MPLLSELEEDVESAEFAALVGLDDSAAWDLAAGGSDPKADVAASGSEVVSFGAAGLDADGRSAGALLGAVELCGVSGLLFASPLTPKSPAKAPHASPPLVAAGFGFSDLEPRRDGVEAAVGGFEGWAGADGFGWSFASAPKADARSFQCGARAGFFS